MKENTLDMLWLQEEETLIHMNSVQAKQPLTNIELRFLFVDAELYVKKLPPRVMALDVSGNVSVLSNECLMSQIAIAKQEYIETYASSGILSVIDTFIWNTEVDHEHLRQYIKNGFPTTFTNVSLSSPIVLKPSLPMFHSLQSIFVVFRECKDKTHKTSNSSELRSPEFPRISSATRPEYFTKSSGIKHTKRVRFQSHSRTHTRKMQ
jgi:hypothetical protein